MACSGKVRTVIAGAKTTLRPATSDDLELLCAWFDDPGVFYWWGGKPIDHSVVDEKYIGKRPNVASFIVEERATPIGYAQAWFDDGGNGIDLVLVPSARGHGCGVDAARALALHLQRAGWNDITVDPAASNARAIGAYKKAGFVPTDRKDGENVILVFSESE